MTDKADIRLQVVYRSIDDLIPYARNSRTHSPAQIRKLVKLIKQYGFVNPILLDGENGILCGHGRLAAAREANIGSVPTIDLGHLSKTEQRAFIIAENRSFEDGGWDEEILALELSELKSLDFDLSLTAFDDKEIKSLLEPEPPKQEDPPPPPASPVSESGDVWLLGVHRLEVGASTDMAVIDAICGVWNTHSGEPARLEATGQSFVEVVAERHPEQPVITKVKKSKAGAASKHKTTKDGRGPSRSYH